MGIGNFERLQFGNEKFGAASMPAATPEVLPTASAAAPSTPFAGTGIVDTTAATLAALNPVVDAPVPAPPVPATLYPSAGASQAAASPASPTKLDYATWVIATQESYPGDSAAELATETSQAAYQNYLQVWATMQQMRQQPGVAAELDALLASMAAS